MEGDTKSSAKGGDTSAKKDAQPNPNSQSAAQHMVLPMQGRQ